VSHSIGGHTDVLKPSEDTSSSDDDEKLVTATDDSNFELRSLQLSAAAKFVW